MKNYLNLIAQSDTNNTKLCREAGSMTQKQFNTLLIKQRKLVAKIWEIRESGKITHN